MLKRERSIGKNRIYKGAAVDFYADTVMIQNGKTAVREYTAHGGAAAAIPFLPGGRIILIEQYRYPVKKIMLEIPAGKILKGETPLQCIKRELAEETGFSAGKFIHLISFYPTCAFSTEKIDIFAAYDLKKTTAKPDEDEFIKRKILNYEEAVAQVKEKKITDSKTIIALLLTRCAKEFR